VWNFKASICTEYIIKENVQKCSLKKSALASCHSQKNYFPRPFFDLCLQEAGSTVPRQVL
jgi:hypothetical protein